MRRIRNINGFDWGSLPWDQIGATTGSVIGGLIGTNDETRVPTGNTGTTVYYPPNNSGSNSNTPLPIPTEKDNTALYIGLAVAAGGLLLFATQSGNRNSIRRRR